MLVRVATRRCSVRRAFGADAQVDSRAPAARPRPPGASNHASSPDGMPCACSAASTSRSSSCAAASSSTSSGRCRAAPCTCGRPGSRTCSARSCRASVARALSSMRGMYAYPSSSESNGAGSSTRDPCASRCSSSATACAASPSPRPVKPSWSVVVARTFTSPPPTASDRRAASRRGERAMLRLLADQHAVGVDERPARLAAPAGTPRAAGRGSTRRGSARRPTGRARRCRRAPPRRARASMSACASTSPSEWPASPRS